LSSLADEYLIEMSVDSASPPVPGFGPLFIVTERRPVGNVRFVHSSTGPSDFSKTARVTVLASRGSAALWDTDSATVDFRTASGRHAVAGDFNLYMNCDHCDPPLKGAHAVVRGRFATHD
jgi:hypothetical protein